MKRKFFPGFYWEGEARESMWRNERRGSEKKGPQESPGCSSELPGRRGRTGLKENWDQGANWSSWIFTPGWRAAMPHGITRCPHAPQSRHHADPSRLGGRIEIPFPWLAASGIQAEQDKEQPCKGRTLQASPAPEDEPIFVSVPVP